MSRVLAAQAEITIVLLLSVVSSQYFIKKSLANFNNFGESVFREILRIFQFVKV